MVSPNKQQYVWVDFSSAPLWRKVQVICSFRGMLEKSLIIEDVQSRVPWKLTCPLKIDGCKMKLPFMLIYVDFQGGLFMAI